MTATGNQIDLSRVECCSLTEGPIEADQAQRLAAMFKALADPTRLRLLSHVTAQGCQDVCACDLTEELQITQPTVSHHMKKLVDAGLVTREQRGKWAHYSVVPGALEELRELLNLS
ncbi:metalloregulator ArsR/SmtB family transcription factor [Enteractinococcus fodinae]|uniref:ArsR family transcriptional regulator n=1 Tax=Enteractinococcus fodinae TaxID=684663 RepID=A0ABU2B1A0_9MICC|nr:metalloregulator ArsR/SmtB family transcription factor [Enteractinococcus fodinae]MDR7346533.1 ArsR family transcriptional regulator [Enteractinococcus fodinae]